MKLLMKSENSLKNDPGQKGSALLIAVFVMILISTFVALALTRTVSEAIAVGNETAEGRTFYAAQASLEMMTRNFNKTFEVKLNPTTADLDKVRTGTVPGHSPQYSFVQEIDAASTSESVILAGGNFAGLYALRDNWRLRTTANDTATGVEVQLVRNVLNNRIPIFQFGIFNDDDLELYRPPKFSFGGRVHTNSNFFISPGSDGIYFDSRVTAAGQVITQTWRNGFTGDSTNDQTFIKNASGAWKQLFPDKGSALNTAAGSPDNIFAANPDMPPSRLNANWTNDSAVFDGNLQSNSPKLKLPLDIGGSIDLVEMIRRGKQVGDVFNKTGATVAVTAADADNQILTTERFANKPGLRISLSDSKAKLPGCATSTGAAVAAACGVRLDGRIDGSGEVPATGTNSLRTRGYQPLAMTDGYVATRVNGERLYNAGRETWIKIETVYMDAVNGTVVTKDITADILSLGVTEQAPRIMDGSTVKFEMSGYNHTATTGTDSRSIIQLQRFLIPGPAIPGDTTSGAPRYVTAFSTSGGASYNAAVRFTGASSTTINIGCPTPCVAQNADPTSDPDSYDEHWAHLKLARVDGSGFDRAVVPFPIKMFDTREGTFFDSSSIYTAGRVTQNGVMSMVDINVGNLRRFLRGDFDGKFPATTLFAVSSGSGLRHTDIPDSNGWVLYVSDRRGDYDFDGEYDMEDIYGWNPSNDGILQTGEDVNKNGFLNTDFINEATRYANTWFPDYAAVVDHKFFRRGVRLTNGTVLPGNFDAGNASNTKGFTVATENGLYVLGNYNATGVVNTYATGNTPYNEYLPFNTSDHIPAAVVADSVTILSNAWNDAKSFAFPYTLAERKASPTTIRFATIAGDTIASRGDAPHQGGISPGLNGGVHNFKRFLERWTDPGNSSFQTHLNYSGSLVNLFNSRNNNGAFKCCNTVYNPPVRNWVFDSTFLDPGRIPPGTPFFQYVQTTGFQRMNN